MTVVVMEFVIKISNVDVIVDGVGPIAVLKCVLLTATVMVSVNDLNQE